MSDEQWHRLELTSPVHPDRPFRYPSNVGDGASVGFSEAVRRGLWGSSAHGRASRSEFWYFQLFCVLLNVTNNILINVALGLTIVWLAIGTIIEILSAIVFIRRLHDVDRSGWWMLISLTGIGLLPLFIWSVSRGDRGPNRFDLPLRGRQDPGMSPGAMNTIEQMERLHRLRTEGAITEDEYLALKQRTF